MIIFLAHIMLRTFHSLFKTVVLSMGGHFMRFIAALILILSNPFCAEASESTPKRSVSQINLNLRARSQKDVPTRPFVFLSGPKSVIVPCIEESSSKSIEEALLISSTALAQKEFFCADLRKPTEEFGLRMCKDSSGNDLVLGAATSKIECLKLLDVIINATVGSRKPNIPSSP
jgi:hypothetical protein